MVILFAGLLMAGLFVLQKALYRRYWNRGLTVCLQFEKDSVSAGDFVLLQEVVENQKRMPLPSLKVKFQCSRHLQFTDRENSSVTDYYYRNDLFSLLPYKRITRTHQILCPRRGCYGIHGIDLVGVDLFFSEEMMGQLAGDAVLYVLPKPLDPGMLDAVLARINGEIAVRRYEIQDPFTFRGIRDYERFDEPKSVNWKATAKTGELKVNMREQTAAGSVRIFMNLEDKDILRREELLEMCISICGELCSRLLAQGVCLNLYANARDCFSNQLLSLEGYRDSTGLDAVNRSLARLDLDAPTENFERAFREKLYEETEASYTLFLSPDRHQDYQQVLREYQRENQECLWICPVMNERDMQAETDVEARAVFVPFER